MKLLATAIGAALVPGQAFAHPGHAIDAGTGLAHVVTDPFHLSLLVLAAALAYGARHAIRRLAR